MRNIVIISSLCFLFACSGNLEKRITLTHPDGSKAVVAYVNKNDTLAHPAKIVRFYMNSEKQEETYYNVKGERHGKHTVWFMSGDKMLEENFENGELHGKATYWGESGKKTHEAHYTHGEASGTWRFFDKEGRLQSEKKFE
ncbi:MAG: hypothetical protein FWC39_13435 [Bacteroidetes bacterium]|nr:hypothetical protein [Bacteroidota bacterium]